MLAKSRSQDSCRRHRRVEQQLEQRSGRRGKEEVMEKRGDPDASPPLMQTDFPTREKDLTCTSNL